MSQDRAAGRRFSTSRCSSRAGSTSATSPGSRARTPRCSSTPSGDATLFTDFRYAQKAKAIDGRPLRADGARRDRRPRDAARRPDDRDRGARPHRREPRDAEGGRRRDRAGAGARRAAARGEGAGRDRDDPRGGGDLRPDVRRARRGALHRPDGARAGLARARALPRARLVGARVRHDRRGGRERREPARGRARRRDSRRDTLVTIDAGCRVDGYCLRLHAHVRDGRSPGRARARLRGVSRGAAGRARRRSRRAPAVATSTQPRAT